MNEKWSPNAVPVRNVEQRKCCGKLFLYQATASELQIQMMISFSPQSCQGRDNITKLDISLLIDQIADLQASFYQQN